MTEQILKSETRQFKAIFPNTLNANGTLFGGEALKWMDEVAYITATRFTRQKVFTVKTENIRFLKAVKPESIVEVVGKVDKIGGVKIYVRVEIYAEEMYGSDRELAVEGLFVFVILSDDMKPQRVGLIK